MTSPLLVLLATLIGLPACKPSPVAPGEAAAAPAPVLAWSMSPSEQTVTPGGIATFTATIERKANINARVNLAVSGYPFQTPPGITVTFDPPRLGESSTSGTVRVQTASNLPANKYSIWVTATEDGGEAVDRFVVVDVRPGASSPTAPTGPGA
jgi:hypothetical protein